MFNAFDIKTGNVIATGADRDALYAEAVRMVGDEGFCIRATEATAMPRVVGVYFSSNGRPFRVEGN